MVMRSQEQEPVGGGHMTSRVRNRAGKDVCSADCVHLHSLAVA